MDLFNLATELEHIERQRRIKLFEATTMGMISYLPVHIGMVKARLKDLARKQKKWGLEVLENDNGDRDVRIGGELRIVVPREYWDNFQEMFSSKLTSDSHLDLGVFLNEALEDDLKELREELKPALFKLFSESIFTSLDKLVQVWIGRFGIQRYLTNKTNVIVTCENKKRDIQKLFGNLLRAYGDDKGDLELLLKDIQDRRPLGAHDVFKKYDYLYGTRIQSKVDDVTLIFETTVDTAFMLSQSIYLDNDNVLDKVEEEATNVKRVGNVVYPEGEIFTAGFFKGLRDIIEDLTGEEISDNIQEQVTTEPEVEPEVEPGIIPKTPSKEKPFTPIKPTPGIHPEPKAVLNKDVELFKKVRIR